MPKRSQNAVIVTYNGLDGACAAAAGLLKYPGARIEITSAARIAETAGALRRRAIRQLHVCGLGVNCGWDELSQPLEALGKKGAEIKWYCGRGYLDADEARFETFCEPVFMDVGTNTAAVARHLGVSRRGDAQRLMGLAELDPRLGEARADAEVSEEQQQWVSLVDAALAQYFKYDDREPYIRAIEALASGEYTETHAAMVKRFLDAGDRYVLHGRSKRIKELRQQIQKCADADAHVIVTGESGVGKEHVAHLIRERSARADGPFVVVNCAVYAGSANLANSDLFGHVKGAFTGAVKDRQGQFISADGGILYLDELGELPLEVQAKLLRVLEDGCIVPVGADETKKKVDVRIIAATNRDMPRLIREGRFRADLYHRLSVLRIEVPPLRDHIEDAALIVEESRKRAGGSQRKLPASDKRAISRYDWPGNVRQLLKLVERAELMGIPVAQAIKQDKAEDAFPKPEAGDGAFSLPRSRAEVQTVHEVAKRYARHVWELYDRNCTAAAKALDIASNTLRYTYLGEK